MSIDDLALLVARIDQKLTRSIALRLYLFSQYCCIPTHDTLAKYGRWVVVTGATDGIGLSMAKEFARRGHSIIVVGRSEEKLMNTKALLKCEPNVGQIQTIQIDLSDSSLGNYKRVELELDAANRDIGVLVNNAGMATDKYMKYADYEMDSIVRTVNVNVLSACYFTRMVLPGMLSRRRGLVVNVSSLMGDMELGYFSVYNATKCFVNSFSRTLRNEYAATDKIDIINLTPGAVHTKMLAYLQIARPSLLMPSADYYARCAVNALRTRVHCYSGCWQHGLSNLFVQWCEYLGLMNAIFFLFAKWKNQPIGSPSTTK